MSLTITHLAFSETRWYMRFAGPQEEFQAMRTKLQGQRFALAHWSREYRWPDGKEGAWSVHGLTLQSTRYDFTNLRGQCKSTQDRISNIYACTFWLDPGLVGYGEYTYYLPR
jgi:hypothetical protein